MGNKIKRFGSRIQYGSTNASQASEDHYQTSSCSGSSVDVIEDAVSVPVSRYM